MSSDEIPTDGGPSAPVVVVVPVYRNAGTLEELAERVHATLSGGWTRDYRLLFVVDSSPDDSWSTVCNLAVRSPRIGGIRLERNEGQHTALLVGLSSLRAEFYAIMDADLQDPPELLKDMVERARSRRATVFAGRKGMYQSWGRMLTSRAFKWLLGVWVGLPANVGTFLVVPDAVLQSMLRLNVRHPQVVVMARHCSHSWSLVPYRRGARPNGRSAYSTRGRVRAALRGIRCAWECRTRTAGGVDWTRPRVAETKNL